MLGIWSDVSQLLTILNIIQKKTISHLYQRNKYMCAVCTQYVYISVHTNRFPEGKYMCTEHICARECSHPIPPAFSGLPNPTLCFHVAPLFIILLLYNIFAKIWNSYNLSFPFFFFSNHNYLSVSCVKALQDDRLISAFILRIQYSCAKAFVYYNIR